MNLLLDTHTFIWFINGDKNLSSRVKRAILKAENTKFISIASLWEMAIKKSLSKLNINQPFEEIINQIQENGFEILPIVFEHTLLVSQLEFHHRDPFSTVFKTSRIKELVRFTASNPFFPAILFRLLCKPTAGKYKTNHPFQVFQFFDYFKFIQEVNHLIF